MQAGNVHFDDAEPWRPGGRNLLWVAAHELGHSLGLRHSSHPDALMSSHYGGYALGANVKLHQDDIDGIQAIYGSTHLSPHARVANWVCSQGRAKVRGAGTGLGPSARRPRRPPPPSPPPPPPPSARPPPTSGPPTTSPERGTKSGVRPFSNARISGRNVTTLCRKLQELRSRLPAAK